MKALFEVGEEVILVSKDFPHLNGDAVVIDNTPVGKAFICTHCGKGYTARFIAYQLNVKNPNVCCARWSQSALRKKPKPSEFSFDEIMSEIKSTQSVKA